MNGDRLHIHLYGRHVAHVIDAGAGECAVEYTPEAVRVGAPARLSLAMPPASGVYPSTRFGTRWVRSLLPEGQALQWATTTFSIPEDDRFALLSVLGRDVAGAAVILPPDVVPSAQGRYEPLAHEQVTELVSRAHEQPLALRADRGVRLSLAGMQDKIVLHRPLRSTKYHLPLDGAPSTVIIKPQPIDRGRIATPGLVANEALCLDLATSAGLRAAKARVERFGNVDCLVVDRFDRQRRAGTVTRIHQEDLLAAMGRDPHLKYERGNEAAGATTGGFTDHHPIRSDPGPTLDDIAELLSAHLGRGILLKLIEIVTFNTAIGNADAHARNLSLQLHLDGTVTLAPLYDLIATRHYPDLSRTAAQAVNDTFDIDDIGVEDILEHGTRWDIPRSTIQRRVTTVLDRLGNDLTRVATHLVDRRADPDHVHPITTTIRARLDHLRS